MFRLFTFTCFVLCCLSVNSQTVRNVNLVGFRDYFIDVCAEVFKTLQETHFHTFRLPDFTQEINATVLGQHVTGHAVYNNAFVVSIDGVDVLQSGLLQRWVSPNATTASVSVEGVMRLRSVKMGFDVDANLNGQSRRRTGSITFPLLHFRYVIHKDLFTDDLTAAITTVVQTTPTRMVMYPADNVTDIISSTYVVTSFNAGALLWGPEIVEPIAQRVIHEVPFPQICYNCPVT